MGRRMGAASQRHVLLLQRRSAKPLRIPVVQYSQYGPGLFKAIGSESFASQFLGYAINRDRELLAKMICR